MRLLKNIFKKSRSPEDGIFFTAIRKIIGFDPKNLSLYKAAFTHRSASKIDENGITINYERLEFLGDAMLSAIIAAHLYDKAPKGDEGYLTKMRSKIVSREHLNTLGKDLKLKDLVQSKVAVTQFGDNIYGNLFEAVVGAIYLDLGYGYCEKFIQSRVIIPYVDISKLEGKITSYKSLVIEWCQKEKKTFFYDVFEDNGINGERLYGVKLSIENKIVAKARASSKKKAEEKASQRAYFALQERITKNS